MLNNIDIQGRLTKDPELRHTQSGKAVASFTLACEQDYSSNGERKTDFIDCVAWDKSGEFVARNFSKGQLILVRGRLTIRAWTDNNGNNRRTAEINVLNAYFCGSKTQTAEPAAEPQMTELDDDENLPF